MSRSVIFLFALLVFNSRLHAQFVKQPLPVADPVSAGYNANFFPELEKSLQDSIPSLGSFVVWSHGNMLCEKYFHGADSTTAFNIKSITKSVVSAMAGIANNKGLLPNLETPVVSFFPEFAKPRALPGVWFADWKAKEDSIRSTLRLKDLLTMQTGWDWNDYSGAVNIFINSSDPVRFTMDIPFVKTPGTQFNYSSAATSLFSAALAKSVKTDLRLFAKKHLFDPAGIMLPRWDKDPAGRYVGASEMFMTSRDLLRFGLVYLHQGKVGGRQVIPVDWIRESTSEHATLNFWDVMPGANGYGYYWWRRKTNGHQAWIASGAGGQLIAVVPDLHMVVVANCLFNQYNRGREEIRRLHFFIDEVTKASK